MNVAFASHCDHGPYVGYVGSVSTTTRALTLWSVETGTKNGLAAQPAAAEFGDVPTGQSKQLGISVQNTGTTVATITGVTVPAAGSHFTVGGAPAVGSKLQPQQSVTLSVTFTDTTAETVSATLRLTADTGAVTIPLSARSLSGSAQLVINPKTLDFGRVGLGTSKNATFKVSNAARFS